MDHHTVQKVRRSLGGHDAGLLQIQGVGLHQVQVLYAHVAGGPGRGPDVLRDLRPKQHDGDVVQVDPPGLALFFWPAPVIRPAPLAGVTPRLHLPNHPCGWLPPLFIIINLYLT